MSCKFLALHQVDKPENGLMPTAVATFSPFDTSPSAKNLQRGCNQRSDAAQIGTVGV
jgi:hypothetical protein